MIAEETVELLRFALKNPKNVIYDLLTFLRERHGDWRNAEARMLRNLVLSLPESEACKYREEIEFLRSCGQDFLAMNVFPYPMMKKGASVTCGYDDKKKLPYVVHKGARLYFCRGDDERMIRYFYSNYLDVEGLLGGGCLRKSPHAYVTDDFCVEFGDILVDVGCSEALFTLDNIEKIDKAYVFETLKRWNAPLCATFAPFGDKVTISNKFVGGETGKHTIKLEDALPNDFDGTFFIKMDIEGGELEVLKRSAEFLKNHKVKLACCLYHRQDDERHIVDLLREMGFKVQLSDGYMLPVLGGVAYPYFRRGVAYARNY